MRVLNRPDGAGDSTMKRTRHPAEQMIRKLNTAEQLIAQANTVADACRVIEEGKLRQRLHESAAQRIAGVAGWPTACSGGKAEP
jgi:hypothetical protein